MSDWFSNAWTAWMLQSAGELTLVLALVCATDRCVRLRLPPKLLHGLWLVMLARLALSPAIGWSPIRPAIDAVVPIALEARIGAAGFAHMGFSCWLLGVVLVFASWCARARFAVVHLEAIVDDSLHARIAQLAGDAGLADVPRVCVDLRAQAPYVTGLLGPRLVLPRDWSRWPQQMFDHALAHELTHLRRRDLWVESLWLLVSALYWFHPLVHLARRQAYEAREMCCDADAAQRIGPAYRSSMLQLIVALGGVGPAVAQRVPVHGWHPAVMRLMALSRRPAAPSWRSRVAGGVLAIAVTAAALPGHVRLSLAPPAADIAILVDPVARQQRGLGSMHVRYALLQQMQPDAAADSTVLNERNSR